MYVLGGRFHRTDLEIRLNWEPRSYWMPIEDEPVSTDSTSGMDLLEPTLETVTVGVWLLCMQARRWTGIPSCMHPLVHTLDNPLLNINLH